MTSTAAAASTSVRCNDWSAVLRRTDRNGFPSAHEREYPNFIGFHRLVRRAFGNEETTRALADTLEGRRSGHSHIGGMRVHACAQHYTHCARLTEQAEEEQTHARKRRRLRAHNLQKRPSRCERCDHPARCRAPLCAEWGATLQRWLDEQRLAPVAVEHAMCWHRAEVASRADMVCVRRELTHAAAEDGAEVGVVVVSLKTLGEGRAPPQKKHGSGACLNLPRSVFREPLPDCEHSRHQLQLMMECITLRDTYALRIDGAYVVYISYGNAKRRIAPALTEHAADNCWYRVLFGDGQPGVPAATLAKYCAIAAHVRARIAQ